MIHCGAVFFSFSTHGIEIPRECFLFCFLYLSILFWCVVSFQQFGVLDHSIVEDIRLYRCMGITGSSSSLVLRFHPRQPPVSQQKVHST